MDLLEQIPLEEQLPMPPSDDMVEDMGCEEEAAPYSDDSDNVQTTIINELNEAKHPMGISIAPDSTDLKSRVADSRTYKATGHICAYYIDKCMSNLFSYLTKKPASEYALSKDDRRMLEGAISDYVETVQVRVSPFMGVALALGTIYGTQIPQVLEDRRAWRESLNSPQPQNGYDDIAEDTTVPIRETTTGGSDTAANADRATDVATDDVGGAGASRGAEGADAQL